MLVKSIQNFTLLSAFLKNNNRKKYIAIKTEIYRKTWTSLKSNF